MPPVFLHQACTQVGTRVSLSFIYLCIHFWLRCVLSLHGLFCSRGWRGLLSGCDLPAFRRDGFPCGAPALGPASFRNYTHGLSCSRASGIFPVRDGTPVSYIGSGILKPCTTEEVPVYYLKQERSANNKPEMRLSMIFFKSIVNDVMLVSNVENDVFLSVSTLLQYCFCFTFWFCGHVAREILAP